MKKIGLITTLLILIGVQSLSARPYDLKDNMFWLNKELLNVREGFMRSKPKLVASAMRTFSKDANELLGNQKEIAHMLPKGKKGEAKEAIIAAEVIAKSAQVIIDEIENKEKHTELERRENAQNAYAAIEYACFRCHNVVRDGVALPQVK